MTPARDTGPFSQTTRPSAYVPRQETEQVLERLKTWVLEGAAPAIDLTAAPGMGKSLLLRVLAERLAGHLASVHVPFPNLDPDEFARTVLETMGEPSGHAPQLELCDAAKRRSAEGGLLLLLDNAERLPPATRDALEHWFQRSAGNLRCICAVEGEPSGAGPLLASLDEGAALTLRLQLAESKALIEAAMDRGGLEGPQRARFNRATLLQIHDRARGIPARLLAEAARVLAERGAAGSPSIASPARVPAPAPTQRELAQLELSLSADSAPPEVHRTAPPAPPPVRSPAPPPSHEPAPPPGHGPAPPPMNRPAPPPIHRPAPPPEGHPETRPARGEEARPEVPPALESAALLHVPQPPPPAAARRSHRSLPRAAAVVGAALALGFGATWLLSAGDGSDPLGDTSVGTGEPTLAVVPEMPPVAASPAAAAAPRDPGVGSIELLGATPARPEPTSKPAPVIPPPPVTATLTAAAARPAPAPTPAVRNDAAARHDDVVHGSIRTGEWLASSFRRNGIPGELAALIAREVGGAYDFRHSLPGDRYRITRNRAGELVVFEYENARGGVFELRLEAGHYDVQRSAELGETGQEPAN